LLKELLI